MDAVNVALAVMGLGELCFGSYVLVTGKVPDSRVMEPEQLRRRGVATVLFGVFFLLQVVGYLGVRLGLFSPSIRGVLLLLALAVGAIALVKYWPQLSLTGRRTEIMRRRGR